MFLLKFFHVPTNKDDPDNDKRTDEIIFGIESDATTTVSWGASTYIVCGSASSYTDQDPASVGIASAWSMWRATSQAVNLFSGYSGDARATFHTNGQSLKVLNADDQNQGYLFTKWSNLTDAGETASNTASFGVNTDFPLFRTAEAYLNIAEAILRGGKLIYQGKTADRSAADIAAKIRQSIDLDPRVTVLGHIQRGGVPTGRDRVNATKMGYLAVELLLAGKTNRIVCTNRGSFTDIDIDEALSMQKDIQKMEVDVLAAMTGI